MKYRKYIDCLKLTDPVSELESVNGPENWHTGTIYYKITSERVRVMVQGCFYTRNPNVKDIVFI